MYNDILQYLHYGIILIFGIYLSAAFIGVQIKRRNVIILFVFSTVVGIINILFFILFGIEFTEQIYPLIIHLPLILFFRFFYKYKIMQSAIAVFISYLCCQISNWIGLFVINITHLEWVYYGVRILIDIVALILLIRFVSTAVAQLLQKESNDIAIFGFMPIVYYIYDYGVTVYTKLFYSGGETVTEFLGFMLCIFYVLFLLVYFKQYEEKRETQMQNQLIEMQREMSQKELEMMKNSEHAITILRHDMRHFLSDISSFIENGENERAQTYISEIIENVDKTIIKKYCNNKIVNMILTSYEQKMEEYGIHFEQKVSIPEELDISDCDISSILSNGLENAIHAVAALEQEKREIKMNLCISNGKLLISMKNTYAKKPRMADGVPQTDKSGHGLGTQSIRYITEKLKGNCQFTVDERYFVLRIVL